MKFASPWALFGLVLVPVLYGLFAFELARRRRKIASLGEHRLVWALVAGFSPRRFWVTRGLWLGALTCLILGLAGPQFGSSTEVLPRRGLDVVFAIDVSRSMRARDVLPDRLERAKAELGLFLGELGENRIGLVAFAGSAFVQCPLTTDAEAVRAFIAALTPEVVPQGGTQLAEGLRVAAEVFAGEAEGQGLEGTAGRVLVVITDGEDHEGGLEAPAAKLQQLGVQLFLIGVGSGLGEPIPLLDEQGNVTDYLQDRKGKTVMTRMSPEVLSEVARLTGGTFIDGTQDPTLGTAQVKTAVDVLEKRDLEARVHTTYVDRSFFAVLLSLLLFAVATMRKEAQAPGGPLS